MTGYIEPAPHEFGANLLFNSHGLTPFFAFDKRVKDGGGSQRAAFYESGERWVATLYSQPSGIVHPGTQLPTGTEWRLTQMREFRIHIQRHSAEDPTGQQRFNAHIAPRWPDMEVEHKNGRRSTRSTPSGFDEGINISVRGGNIDFGRYHPLLREAAGALDIHVDYFEKFHEYSNIQDAARRVRVHSDASGPIHARSGPIAAMGHLLEHDRSGYRKTVQNDDDQHGNNVPGYYHTVTLGQKRVREAFPSHCLPKEIKHYYARHSASLPEDNPLAHPKVEVSYQASRWDETLYLTPENLEMLKRELDQTLLSVLAEAGLDISPRASSSV